MTNKLVIENLKFRPVRSALSVIAVALEVTLILTIVGLSKGTLDDSAQRARGIGADIFVRPPGSSVLSLGTASIPEAMPAWVEKQPHVTMAVGTIVQPVQGLLAINGIDIDQFSRMSGGFRYVDGGPPQRPDDIIVDRYYAQQDKLHAGSKVKLLNRMWNVSGVFEEGKMARIVMPLKILQDLTGNNGKISQIYVKVDSPADVRPVMDELKSKLVNYPIYSTREYISLLSPNNVPMLKAFTGVVIGISVAVGFLVIFLSMYTAVLERTREVGILKALGATPAFVLGVLLRETAMLAVTGAVLGIACSFVTRVLIATFASAMLSQSIVPTWWPIASGIALVGALFGSAYPGWRAASHDPIEALSYE